MACLKKLITRNKNKGDNIKVQEISLPFIIAKCSGVDAIIEKNDKFVKVTINSRLAGDLDAIICIKSFGSL